jgi:hypothetical protein
MTYIWTIIILVVGMIPGWLGFNPSAITATTVSNPTINQLVDQALNATNQGRFCYSRIGLESTD